MDITISEVGRDLIITTEAGEFKVPPLPASKGAALHAWFFNISIKGAMVLTEGDAEETAANMLTMALGEDAYAEANERLRLPEVQPVALIAMYWQTTGIESAQAFLDGGPKAAMEHIMSQMGLSQQTTLPNSVLAKPTQ